VVKSEHIGRDITSVSVSAQGDWIALAEDEVKNAGGEGDDFIFVRRK
jgi:hypothetical protein